MSEKNPLDYRGNPLSDFEVYLLFDGVSSNPRDDVQVARKRAQTLSNALFCIGQLFYMFWWVQAVRDVLSAFLALAATAKPSPWPVDARNAQEFCSASPVPDQ